MSQIKRSLSVRFLGVGDASQQSLGHASIVVDDASTKLLVDCGPGVLSSYIDTYQALPQAVFITHCHLDHIADFEKLFIKCWFSTAQKNKTKIFVPVDIIPLLHSRVANYPGALAEGGVNFWEAFQLIPVSSGFEFSGLSFKVFPVRHHGLNSAYSLYLEDCFYYTGDTRPIPEIIEYEISEKSIIFHDCSVVGNPSHTGIDDIFREYKKDTINRMRFYHYNQADDQHIFYSRELKTVKPGDVFSFNC